MDFWLDILLLWLLEMFKDKIMSIYKRMIDYIFFGSD